MIVHCLNSSLHLFPLPKKPLTRSTPVCIDMHRDKDTTRVPGLHKASLDGLLEALDDRDHASLIDCETQAEGIGVVELRRP